MTGSTLIIYSIIVEVHFILVNSIFAKICIKKGNLLSWKRSLMIVSVENLISWCDENLSFEKKITPFRTFREHNFAMGILQIPLLTEPAIDMQIALLYWTLSDALSKCI